MKILHLVDDIKPGGVVAMVERISGLSTKGAVHEKLMIKRGGLYAPKLDADIIISHLSICWQNLPFLISLRARNADIKIFHVEHTYCAGFEEHNVSNVKRFRNLLRLSYSLFNRVINVSQAQNNWFREHHLSPPHRTTVIANAIDTSRFSCAPKNNSDTKITRIVALGRFQKQKGFDILIQGFLAADLPDTQLVLHGYGPDEALLKELAGNDPRISFNSFSNTPEKIYQDADIIAIPSRWEAFGLVSQEARAAKCMILHSGVDGLAEQSPYAETCVTSNNIAGWKAKLLDLPNINIPLITEINTNAVRQEKSAFERNWLNIFGLNKAYDNIAEYKQVVVAA